MTPLAALDWLVKHDHYESVATQFIITFILLCLVLLVVEIITQTRNSKFCLAKRPLEAHPLCLTIKW